MPVIVVGADTLLGEQIVAELAARGGEVRAFVGDPRTAADMKATGVKIATGDVSDASHVAAAALGAFCAVLVEEAGRDGRERAFAADEEGVWAAWRNAMAEAGINRLIWVGERGVELLTSWAPEVAVVGTTAADPLGVARAVADLNDRAAI